jgi:DNA-binding NtrC family response regulator
MSDLGATNGTYVAGVRVLEALLRGGETIELGDSSLRVVRAGNLAATPVSRGRFGRVLGGSQEMQRVFALAERLSPSPLPLLIEGETGTGKALLAEAIHDAGPRARGPFVVFDCGAHGPDEQLVALHVAIEQASGGTLVLDEVGDLDGVTTGARIALPPLRTRHGDVERLARHFWQMFGGAGELPKAFTLQLSRHAWPGNVRELEHAVAQRVTLGDELALAPSDYDAAGAGDPIESVLEMNLAMSHARQLVLEEFERRYVERAVAQHGGNVSRAAAASGVTRRYFHMLRSKMKR